MESRLPDLDSVGAGGRSSGSLACAGLGNTYFWIDPGKGVAGVVLMQLLPFAYQKALDLLDGFETAVYAVGRVISDLVDPDGNLVLFAGPSGWTIGLTRRRAARDRSFENCIAVTQSAGQSGRILRDAGARPRVFWG
jgi:CubicO group peptidase (beta-lactamase class C family)